jgi:hypothetical protein
MAELSIHNVSKIRVEAHSSLCAELCRTVYWQVLTLLDSEDRELGKVVLHLTGPGAALPLGDQPPYWGLDLTKPAALFEDGESPF